MKLYMFFLIGVIFVNFLFAAPQKEAENKELIVLAYDSFVADWGLGPLVAEQFEAETSIKVQYINGGDSIATVVLAQQYAEDDMNRPDVIVGVDNNMISLVNSLDILSTDPIEGQKKIEVTEDSLPSYLVPFDYGYFSIVYNSEMLTEPPSSLQELTDPRFLDSLVLMHPSSSGPGASFLYWTIAEFGEEGIADFWSALKPSILSVTDSWETGYGMFIAGEAPMVLSYTSSPAYHIEYEQTDIYKTAIFPSGHYIHIEGAGVTSYARDVQNAREFVLFLQTEAIQQAVPLTNIMYPISTETELPASFQSLEKPSEVYVLEDSMIEEKGQQWLDEWNLLMSQ